MIYVFYIKSIRIISCVDLSYIFLFAKKPKPKPLNDGSSRQLNKVRVKNRNKLCSVPHLSCMI